MDEKWEKQYTNKLNHKPQAMQGCAKKIKRIRRKTSAYQNISQLMDRLWKAVEEQWQYGSRRFLLHGLFTP